MFSLFEIKKCKNNNEVYKIIWYVLSKTIVNKSTIIYIIYLLVFYLQKKQNQFKQKKHP